jgi:Fe-S-cluster containining protein
VTEDEPLPAGRFRDWLDGMERALRAEQDSAVPCGHCTACCTSSQFVHIEPDETDTLAHIPPGLLFPAPQMPIGHVLLGYDDRGHCPMLVDGACSIYEHRPRTCRTYDCRVFAATGVEPDGVVQVAIALRAGRWRFELADDEDRAGYDAAHAAAANDDQSANPTERAVRAIRTILSLD